MNPDMTLMPDPETAHLDPFYAQTTMAIFCDILEPTTGEGYERDPRMTAKAAEAYLNQTGIGDTIMVGPEAEFFIFDDVRFTSDAYDTGFKLDSSELPTNTGTEYEMGNMVTARASRVAISRSTRSTAARTSAPKCLP